MTFDPGFNFFSIYQIIFFEKKKSDELNEIQYMKTLQLGTNKHNNFIISGTRFFGENLMTDLKPDGQKELKNGVFMLFPRFLAAPNF